MLTDQQQDKLQELEARGYPSAITRREMDGNIGIAVPRKMSRGVLLLAISPYGDLRANGRGHRFDNVRECA